MRLGKGNNTNLDVRNSFAGLLHIEHHWGGAQDHRLRNERKKDTSSNISFFVESKHHKLIKLHRFIQNLCEILFS